MREEKRLTLICSLSKVVRAFDSSRPHQSSACPILRGFRRLVNQTHPPPLEFICRARGSHLSKSATGGAASFRMEQRVGQPLHESEKNPSAASLPALAKNARTGHPSCVVGEEIKTEGWATRLAARNRRSMRRLRRRGWMRCLRSSASGTSKNTVEKPVSPLFVLGLLFMLSPALLWPAPWKSGP